MEYVFSSGVYYPKYSLLSKPNLVSKLTNRLYFHLPSEKDSSSFQTSSLFNFQSHFQRKKFRLDDSFDSKIIFSCSFISIDGSAESQHSFLPISSDEFGLCDKVMYSNRKRTMHDLLPPEKKIKLHSFYSNGLPIHYHDNLIDSLELKSSPPLNTSEDFTFCLNPSSLQSTNPNIMSLNEYQIMFSSLNFCFKPHISLNDIHINDLTILEHQIQDQLHSITRAHNSLLNFRKSLNDELLTINEREVISQTCFGMLSEKLKLIYNRKKEIFKLAVSDFHSICENPDRTFIEIEDELPFFSPPPINSGGKKAFDFECNTPVSLEMEFTNSSYSVHNEQFDKSDKTKGTISPELFSNSFLKENSLHSYPLESVKLMYLGKFQNPTEGKSILSLKLSGNSLFVASAAWVCYRFDIYSGFLMNTYAGHKQPVTCMEILVSKCKRLYTGSSDKTIRCYDITTANCLCIFTFEAQIMCVSISSDILLVGLSSGIMPCINLAKNILLSRSSQHKPKAISYIYSTRKFVFTGSFDCTIGIYKIRHCFKQDELCCLFLKKLNNHKGAILSLYLRGDILYSGSVDRTVLAYDVSKGIIINKYLGHELPVSSIHVLVTVLITACLDKKIRIFHINSSELLQTYIGYNDQLFSMSMRKNVLYTGSKDGTIIALDIDLSSYFQCFWSECELSFSSKLQIKLHLLEDHINLLQDNNISICGWGFCQEFLSHLTFHAKRSHILSHVENLQQKFRLPSKSEILL